MNPSVHNQRLAIIDTCKQMNALGINQGTAGNISLRAENRILITASGIPYEDMEIEHIVEMDLEGGYYGQFLPSSEWRMHQGILNHFPLANAVIHTHSTYATALSCLRKDIPAFHYMIATTGGATLRCAQYATFGSEQLSENMLLAIKDRNSCLLSNHGMICYGEDLSSALALAVEIEALCKQYFIACQAGDPVILDNEEMEIVLKKFETYGKQPNELASASIPAVEAPMLRH